METVSITQDNNNPDLFQITLERRSLKALQAAARSYERTVVASKILLEKC